MEKIVYLIGTGATIAELHHQGVESYLSMFDIQKSILNMSNDKNGKYKDLYDRFGLPPEIDIEQMISLLEGCTFSESKAFEEVCKEIKEFFRIYLLSQITNTKIQSKLSACLLHLHNKYGHYMCKDGEDLLGVLTINYDSLIEQAYISVYQGLNIGYPYESKEYNINRTLPILLKLHGSFNWQIRDNALTISSEFEKPEYEHDYSGWMPPSVYKKPGGVFETIWNHAAALLTDCTILRVIGSSLRSEDFALLSLIFTSQIKSPNSFKIELIVNDDDAIGSDTKPLGIMRRLPFLSRKINFSNLDIYPDGFVSKGNVYKEWLEMKIHEVEHNSGLLLSDDQFLRERLWEV